MIFASLQGPFFLSNLSGQKGRHFSYVPVPGRGLFFLATYLDKKDTISRTFQFLAGAFFSQQLMWTKRTPFLVRSSSWQWPFSSQQLIWTKRTHFSYVPVPGRGLCFSATYLDKNDPFLVRSSSWQGPFFHSNLSGRKGPISHAF